ncbi:tetratricopeptide repeat protein [Pseudoxanthomonas sp. PXM02]|uniref:tetratricopeptide repeat protein n=1 Tax=Pseudoxanthomonas sp. PXM02 TaxID=2769294 RepID=UPI001783E497|nr:tetratricopeptide repeat protein [Pseudoxanthomonas sp. PXM02]MBD9477667.1 tetratricopeptide repeat protein [Pseudoxanthomonas sp. PXM02]
MPDMDVRSLFLLALLLPTACDAKQTGSEQPSLAEIAATIDSGQGDSVEALLLRLNREDPRNAEVMAQLARIDYLRAVEGLAQVNGMPPMGWDPDLMASAERWAQQSTEADPRHAIAWVVYAQIRHAQFRTEEALAMLDRAELLDPSNRKLRLRKGAVFRVLANERGDPALLRSALTEYRKVIVGDIDTGEERLAASELAEIHGALGEHEVGIDYLSRALLSSQGSERAFLLDRRAKLHLEKGQVDAAVEDSRTALEQTNFGVGRATLTQGLLVKAGLAMRDGGPEQAAPFVADMLRTGESPGAQLRLLASMPATFPALYGVLVPDLIDQGGRDAVAKVVGEAAAFIAPDDLRRLQSSGVNLNYLDPRNGTLLQRAIAADNVAAVRALLEMGVDTRVAHPSGRSLLETTLVGTGSARKEIRTLVLAKVGKPHDWNEPAVDLPKKGQWYRTTRAIGQDDGIRRVLSANQTVLGGDACFFEDRPDLCLTFYSAPGKYLATVAIPMSQLDDLNALEEVAAPAVPEPGRSTE